MKSPILGKVCFIQASVLLPFDASSFGPCCHGLSPHSSPEKDFTLFETFLGAVMDDAPCNRACPFIIACAVPTSLSALGLLCPLNGSILLLAHIAAALPHSDVGTAAPHPQRHRS